MSAPAPGLRAPLADEWRLGDRLPVWIARAVRWGLRIGALLLAYRSGHEAGRRLGVIEGTGRFAAAMLRPLGSDAQREQLRGLGRYGRRDRR